MILTIIFFDANNSGARPLDIELARTFLEITRSGSFIAAAERLHITQTTVTARIQNLESALACKLFVRNRSGAHLTDNGQHFVHYAHQLVQVWEASRRDLPLPESRQNQVSIGCEMSLWNPLMAHWLGELRRKTPELALRAEVGDHGHLNKQLTMGLLDIVLVHQPEYSPGVQIEHILDEKLVMVSSAHEREPYIYVDWGEDFRDQHDAALPHLARSSLVVNLGPLALQCLLEYGGHGYFRTRVITKHLHDGNLIRVDGAPEFSYPVYLAQKINKERPSPGLCIDLLKTIIHERDDWS